MRSCAAILIGVAAAAAAAAPLRSSPTLGLAEGTCRLGETGPAIVVTPQGMKDRKGLVQAELYPDNEDDFLADDNLLLNAGKTFRRSETAVPRDGPVSLCIRVPGPGTYALSILHDRDSNHKFGFAEDGIGFPGNPRLGLHKPPVSGARVVAGPGITPTTVTMNYRRGLLSFGPIGGRE